MADERENKLMLKLYRPKLGVGAKTFIALSIMFWIPASVAVAAFFYLFQNLIYENITESVKIQLKGAKLIYEEKAAAAEAALSQI
ncbi:MAG: hypothetical protein HZB81_03135, partial [Deltaproteobacteria bacterium]|nr:hypothetical protein [Deltaproteobacteria bacterium]